MTKSDADSKHEHRASGVCPFLSCLQADNTPLTPYEPLKACRDQVEPSNLIPVHDHWRNVRAHASHPFYTLPIRDLRVMTEARPRDIGRRHRYRQLLTALMVLAMNDCHRRLPRAAICRWDQPSTVHVSMIRFGKFFPLRMTLNENDQPNCHPDSL